VAGALQACIGRAQPERLAQVVRRTKWICRLSIFRSVFFLFDEVPHLALLFGIGFKTGKSLDVSFRHFDLDLQRSDRPPADAHPLWATGAARLWPPVTSFRESPPVVAPGSTPPACLLHVAHTI
jgi:hypothetical protein